MSFDYKELKRRLFKGAMKKSLPMFRRKVWPEGVCISPRIIEGTQKVILGELCSFFVGYEVYPKHIPINIGKLKGRYMEEVYQDWVELTPDERRVILSEDNPFNLKPIDLEKEES